MFIEIGIIIGKFFNIPYFTIAKEVNLIDLLSIAVTILLAIFITIYFEKQKSDIRTEKDIVIRKVEDVFGLTNEFQRRINAGSVPFADVTSSLKKINMSLKSIYSIVEKCEFSIKKDIQDSLDSALTDLRKLLTLTPRSKGETTNDPNPPIKVVAGTASYNSHRINQLDSLFERLKNLLFELEIRINKK